MNIKGRVNVVKTGLGLLSITILVSGILASPLLFAHAQNYQQVASTDKGSLKVGVSTDPQNPKPSEQTKLKIDFLNPKSNIIQEHIDYTITITKNGKSIFGPIPLTHTSLGTVTIPVQFKENGEHQVIVDMQGILFQPIPSEKATITVKVGEQISTTKEIKKEIKKNKLDEKKIVKKPLLKTKIKTKS